jgi:hypothetical protein
LIGLLRPDEYYVALRPGGVLDQLYQIGQFFWAPSMFLLDNHRRYLVRSTYGENSGERHGLEPADLTTEFDQPGELSPTLGIRSDERALVVGAKRRPVILMSRAASTWSDGRRRSDDCYLVAPVYSFSGDETRASYSTEFIDRVKGYMYWQLFYLPPSGNGRVREGFVRLDRIQAVHRELMGQMPVMLSEDVLGLLRDWVRVYLGEDLYTVNDLLFDYREDAVRQLS